jgi:hypothetical protein
MKPNLLLILSLLLFLPPHRHFLRLNKRRKRMSLLDKSSTVKSNFISPNTQEALLTRVQNSKQSFNNLLSKLDVMRLVSLIVLPTKLDMPTNLHALMCADVSTIQPSEFLIP